MPTTKEGTRAAADAWAREHGCRDILACNSTPLAAFEAGVAAERERITQLADKHAAFIPGERIDSTRTKPGQWFSVIIRESSTATLPNRPTEEQ